MLKEAVRLNAIAAFNLNLSLSAASCDLISRLYTGGCFKGQSIDEWASRFPLLSLYLSLEYLSAFGHDPNSPKCPINPNEEP